MRKTVFLIFLLGILFFGVNVNAVYFEDEINDEMIKNWIDEVREYRTESTLDLSWTKHDVFETELTTDDTIAMTGLSFYTYARKIMEESHDMHRKYIEPEINDMREILSETSLLYINQVLVVEDRSDRDTEKMHLVFFSKELNDNGEIIDEKVIQPEIVEDDGSSQYMFDLDMHFSSKTYAFKYDDFPSHQEYINGNFIIEAKHISEIGEIDLEIPWDEIR